MTSEKQVLFFPLYYYQDIALTILHAAFSGDDTCGFTLGSIPFDQTVNAFLQVGCLIALGPLPLGELACCGQQKVMSQLHTSG